MDFYILKLILLFVSGYIAGIINTIAGGGSFLTIPILIFLGLPPTVANATNRLSVFMQSLSGLRKFREHKVLPLKFGLIISIPATVGALMGAYMATIVSDVAFKKYLAVFMVLMTLLTFLNPGKMLESRDVPISPAKWVFLTVAMFIVGIYGGFIQAGVGFLFLAAMSITGYDLLRGNALKMFVVLVLTTFSLIIFIASGKVNFFLGLVLGVGSVLGAHTGASLSVKKGNKFIQRFVVVAVISFAVLLLLDMR
ncbi:sulfite exporter TauE/SafE family protein [Limisalsivibrio acetivorans]|uniref:sulfite exporter TauE/SafE family protein n=1 Tax=Limisalsivibrio acetivorans TaxID=1304888 RepID=UPI0003B35E8A|nr:TSUP family transporter [Limisalsivibrio acetivorans]